VSEDGINSPIVAKGPSAVCYGVNGDKAGTLDSSYYKGCGMRSGVEREIVAVPQKTRYIVRRLTPLECERLQGFPDGWTDIGEYIDTNGKKKQSSDAARYKALGNSIALPPWKWVLKRLCACYERDATMASLFDGIGGFPLLWEQINGKGACLWASEIEEFPIAVTKNRFGGDIDG
jgi:DNA (cytosine-5)-methyltransferase 1